MSRQKQPGDCPHCYHEWQVELTSPDEETGIIKRVRVCTFHASVMLPRESFITTDQKPLFNRK